MCSGSAGKFPVVATMSEGLALKPTAVLIGIAPQGGRLPAEWQAWLLEAIAAGCDIWSGLHTFLGDDPVLAERAKATGTRILDLRRPPANLSSPRAWPRKWPRWWSWRWGPTATSAR